MHDRRLAAWILALGFGLTACHDSLTGPEQPAPTSFARCDDPFSAHQPPPSHGDVFVTPEERAFAQAETGRVSAILDRHVDALFALPWVIATGVGYAFDLREFVIVVSYDQAGPCPLNVPGQIEGVRVLLDPSSPAVAQ